MFKHAKQQKWVCLCVQEVCGAGSEAVVQLS